MAVDNIGATVNVGDLCLMGGVVREIEGDVLVVVTADGRHAFRVKAPDARVVSNVPDPVLLDEAIADAVAGKVDTATLSAYAQKAAGVFTTVPPTSDVAATATKQLVRYDELVSNTSATLGTVATFLALKQDIAGLGTIAFQSTRAMVVQITANTSGLAWTNMPAAHSMLYGNICSVRKVDLTSYTQCRLTAVQFAAAASGSKLRLRYGASGSSNPDSYSAIAASELELALGTGAGGQYLATSWTNLVAGAKSDTFIAVTGISGDGAADPSFFSVLAEFR